LVKLFRSEDQVTRYGGDEFVIVCENLANEIELETLIKRVFETTNTPYNLNGILINVSVSMGVTIYPKDTALTPSELVEHADEAMYSAKQSGKNRHHYY
jgi:diguanylate cyclase (GGDEF)-like protein